MKKTAVAAAVGAAMGVAAGSASAAIVNVSLTKVKSGSPNGTSTASTGNGQLTGTLTGTYNTTTGVVTMDAGTTTALFNVTPSSSAFTHNHSNWTTGSGGYSASAYSCVEGTFGNSVGASLCGNYNFGANFVNESSTNYNVIPGTRSLGGDDIAIGPHQQGTAYSTSTALYDGVELIMISTDWVGGTGSMSTGGIQLIFNVSAAAVPVPAAVWLFGSALGLLGWARRRA